MGRYATFANGFTYKFWFACQTSGFDFLEGNGVESDEYPEYDLVLFLENDGEHHFCDRNCDKEIKSPHEMLWVNGCVFCDTECHAKFNGVMDNVGDVTEQKWKEDNETKYQMILWAKEQDDYVNEDEVPAEYRDKLDKTPINNFQLTVERNELLTHLQTYGYQLPKFDEYEGDTKGTTKMYNDVLKQWNNQDESDKANFCLGCIIYHMSNYDNNISGMYEC
jgi:hypothetical protein